MTTTVRPANEGDLPILVHLVTRELDIDPATVDPEPILDALREIAASGTTPAEEMLAKFAGPWGGRIDPLYDEYAF